MIEIKNWIIQLAAIIIIISIVDIFIEGSKYKPYVRFVAGIFVIFIILAPIYSLVAGGIGGDFDSLFGNIDIADYSTDERTKEIFSKTLKSNIEAYVNMLDGIDGSTVIISLGNVVDGIPQIKSVSITANAESKDGDITISKVRVSKDNLVESIKTSVSSYFGIDKDAISVTIISG